MHYRIISINNYNNYTYHICLCSMCHDKKITLLHCILLLHCCHVFCSIVFPFYVTFIWVLVWEVHLASESWTGNLIYSEGEILAQHNTSWLYIKVISNTNNIYGNGKTKARCQKQSAAQKYLDVVDFGTNMERDLSDLSSTKFTNLHIF